VNVPVAVVGLGAAGSAIAWQLAARGHPVMGLDRFHPPHGYGSSAGRSRIIREAYWESPFYVPIVRRAYELWAELERETQRTLLRPTGGVVIGPPAGRLIAGALGSAERHSIPVERLSASQIRERFPFAPGEGMVGVWEPRAGALAPEQCIGAMLELAARAGADLRFDTPVLDWSASSESVELRTGEGTLTTAVLVLAAGAWMAGPLAGTELPLRVARQTMFWLRPRTDQALFGPSRCPVWLWETREGAMYYGFPDLGDGPKVARHHAGQRVDPDTVDRHVSPEEAENILGFLRSAVPDLAGEVTDARVCLYTNTPDEDFIIDRHPGFPNVWVVSPCSGHGFKFAPALGEAVADLVGGKASRFDLAPFRLGRFDGRGRSRRFP